MKRFSTRFALLASVGLLGSVLAVPAHAVLTLRITTLAGTSTYFENCGAGCISVVQNDADFAINLQIGTSNAPGGPANLHLDSLVTSSHGANPLKIEISETGYLFPVSPPSAELTLNTNANSPAIGGATGTATINGYLDNGNVLFCEDTAVCDYSVGPHLYGGFGLSSQSSFTLTDPVAPYSMEILVNALFTSAGSAQGTFNLSLISVPEPASVALLGGVLLFCANAIRRRRAKA